MNPTEDVLTLPAQDSTPDERTRELLQRAGAAAASEPLPEHLRLFASQAADALRRADEACPERVVDFETLLTDVARRVLRHPVIAGNRYLRRFSQGVTLAQARHELQQFSVFAIHFDIAQAKLVANAPTRDAYEERLKVLLNEKGIPYAGGFEGELTGRWSMKTVHFTWLEDTARGLGLNFEDIGKIRLAHDGTRAFIDTVFTTYASDEPNTAAGAAFAVETWAANALWRPWIDGMRALNATLDRPAPLGYLTYHEAEERHHSQAVLAELLDDFGQDWFDAEAFLRGAEIVLTRGMQAYYEVQLRTMPERTGDWPWEAF